MTFHLPLACNKQARLKIKKKKKGGKQRWRCHNDYLQKEESGPAFEKIKLIIDYR